MVMTVDKKPFPAKWTEHSAGKTVPSHLMYRHADTPETTGVSAPLAEQDRKATFWQSRVSKETLARIAGLDRVHSCASLS